MKPTPPQPTLRHHSSSWLHKCRAVWRRRRSVRLTTYILGPIIVLLAALQLWSVLFFTPIQNARYGASFSPQYAQQLGVDWHSNLKALLDDMQLRDFRLMSYWPQIQPKQNEPYRFSDLDWQVSQIGERHGHVSLAVGLRQPRWPECHEPDWATELSYQQWQNELNAYLTAVITRYRNNPTITSYQLENESLNDWFGGCQSGYATVNLRQRLVAEYQMIKRLDPTRPIVMSLSDEHGLPLGKPVPDVYGISMYRIVWNDKGPFHFYLNYPAPVWWHRLRDWAVRALHRRPVIIHELQMEPWGPEATKDMSIDEQNRSMSPAQIHKNFEFARRTGVQQQYLWGSEWWYWRKTKLHDPSIWNAVKQEVNGHQER